MRKDSLKMYIRTKKGVTLVELVVSMTLVALFAVVCVSLINPIERIYQHTVKLSHAQLIADTVVDSIRKECDDVDNSEESSVWIAEKSGDDASSLINKVNPEDSGSILIMRKNGNYCEAIFSCYEITEDNLHDVSDTKMTGSTYGHAASSLLADSNSHNRNSGYVHFGYYQAKDNNNGVTPYKAYDYTNPLTASTYEGYTVSLSFKGIGYKTDANGVKHPTYVELAVSVYDGDYKDGESKRIYTRSTVISFSPNGSGKGTHGGDTPSTTKDIDVRVRWVDEAGKRIDWPDTLLSIDIIFNGSSPVRKVTVPKGREKTVFRDVEVTGSPSLTCTIVPGYSYTVTGNVNKGYVVTYQKLNLKTVKLICGTKFVNAIDQNNVTGVIFGKKTEWINKINGFRSSGATVVGPTRVAIAYDAQWDSSATKDDYVLYKVTQNGKLTAYVLSDDGRFVLNDSCKKMFINCKKLESITGMTGPDPFSSVFSNELTTDMQSMFEGCELITSFKLVGLVTSKVTNTSAMFLNCTGAQIADLSGWNTSGVTTMKNMFNNCKKLNLHSEKWDWNTSSVTDFTYMFSKCDVNADGAYTIDISSFKFSQSKNINMSYMFEGCGAKTIVFPESISNSDFAKKVTTIEKMFNNCTRLEEIDNFLVNADSSDAASVAVVNPVIFSGVTNANNLFSGCVGLKNVRLQISLPSCEKITEFFSSNDALKSVDLSKSDFRKVTNLNYFFHHCNGMNVVKMNEIVLTSFTGSTTQVFEDCYNLLHLEIKDSDLRSVTNARFITRDSLEFCDLSGAKLWAMTSCENMFKIISNEAGREKQIRTVYMIGTELNSSVSYKHMFINCYYLNKVVFSPKTSSAVTEIDCTGMFTNCYALTSFDHSDWNKSKVSNMSYFFENCRGLSGFSFSEVDLDICTNMSYMFTGCTGIVSNLHMSGLYAPKLENCEGMFQGCTNLDIGAGNFAGWDISKVTNLSSLFKGCTMMGNSSNGVISLSGMHFDACKTMADAFNGCSLITTLKLNDVNLAACSDFTNFIAGCPIETIEITGSDLTAASSLSFLKVAKTVDLSSSTFGLIKMDAAFKDSGLESISLNNTEFTNCDSFYQMFYGCKNLTTIDMTGLKATKVESCKSMFEGCSELDLELGDLFNWNTASVTNMDYIFKNCTKLGSSSTEGIVSLSGMNLGSCTSMKEAFNGCSAIKTLQCNEVDLKSCADFTNWLANCSSLTKIEILNSDLSSANNLSFLKVVNDIDLTKSKFTGVTSLKDTFKGSSIKKITLKNTDFSNATDCTSMFHNCYKLEKINASGMKIGNCTNMTSMFEECNNVTSIDLSGWDTSNVTNMNRMFFDFASNNNDGRIRISTEYITVDIRDFSFENLITCDYMFNTEAKGGYYDFIKKVVMPSDPDKAKALKLTSCQRMFRKRAHLEEIEYLHLLATTNKLTNTMSMFSECDMLVEIDIHLMNLSKVTNTQYMFNCSNGMSTDRLTTIYVSSNPDFALGNISDNNSKEMFNRRKKLVGQRGTACNGSVNITAKYACIDDPDNGKPGYFTAK